MYFEKDELMQALYQLSETLDRIVKPFAEPIRQKKFGEAIAAIERQMVTLVGLSPDLIETLPADEILHLLNLRGGSEAEIRDRCIILATLLKQQAGIEEIRNQGETADREQLKALRLLTLMLSAHDQAQLPGYAPSAERLATGLYDYVLPPEADATVVGHSRRMGAYADAESIMFEWLEAKASDPPKSGAADRDDGSRWRVKALPMPGHLRSEDLVSALCDLELRLHPPSAPCRIPNGARLMPIHKLEPPPMLQEA